jgi:hypothetical protein
MLTPEHKFDLLKTVIAVVPATFISTWALISQRRQVRPKLEVLLSPIFWSTVSGQRVLGEELPGIVVRNQSAFPLRICNVGFKVGKKYFEFGKPLLSRNSQIEETEWPFEINPRARAAFFIDNINEHGVKLTKAIAPELKGKRIWKMARGYAMTECGRQFTSKKMSRRSIQALRRAEPHSNQEK